MKLILEMGWTGIEELVSENPTCQNITELLNSLDWKDFNSVRLEQDSKNWIDVSGSLNSDGLAVVYEEGGTQYISDSAPESISQLEEILIQYLEGDMRFKNFGFSSFTEKENLPEASKTDYDLWRAQYEASQKIDKRNQLIAGLAAVIVTGLIGAMIYLMFTHELKFIGRDTNYIIARVTEVKLKYGFKGNLYQQVKYEFEYKGESFKGYFRGTSITGRHKIDDQVKVKFAKNNPNISKRVSTVKRAP